ncbi:MAG: ABC transporter ATP-binding protein, partial [Deltaproteobacteria bacterium]|nr:ABC transporter ATP-binding protein [Deltaproteobacteria bacterium]
MRHDFGYIEEDQLKQSYDVKLLMRLAGYLKPYRSHLVFSVFLVFIITGVELLLPYLTKVAIDDYILVTARKLRLPVEDPLAMNIREKYQNLLLSTGAIDTFFLKEKDINRIDQRLLLQVKKRGWIDDVRYYPAPLYQNTVQNLIKSHPELIQISEETAFIRYDHLKSLPLNQLINLRQIDISGVLRIGAVFILLLLLGFLGSYGQIYYMEYTGQRVLHDLRLHLCSHLQNLSLRFFDRNPVGRLVTRATNDIQNLQDMFSSILVQFLKDLILLLGIMMVMLSLNWRLALICFALLPIIFGVTIFFSIKARGVFREVRKLIARINSYIQENFSGILVVKIFNRERENSRRFQQINHEHFLANIRQIVIFAIFMPAVEIFGSIAIALLLWKGGGQVISQTISLGVLVAFLAYIQKMFQPIRFLAEKYNIMQSALASAERIFSLLDEKDIIHDPPTPKTFSPVKGKVEFTNVVFAYDGGKPVLRNISFQIQEGETVAVVGSTGAGKSTLIKLLARFYDVQGGKILIDVVDIRSLEKSFVRSQIRLVMQEPFLFAESIGYNVRLGNTKVSDADLENVTRLVNADRFINKLNKGLEEVISEEGTTLSTGER